MSANNLFLLTGFLGKDAEMQYTQRGTAIVKFSMCVKGFGKDAEGTWFDITMFGERAEKLQQYLKKGSNLSATGRLTVEKWNDKEGNPRSRVGLIADDISFVGGGNGGKKPAGKSAGKGQDDDFGNDQDEGEDPF